MKYFEVLYKNCFGEQKRALVATNHVSPEIPTMDFNFNWNGNRLIAYCETDQYCFARNIYRQY